MNKIKFLIALSISLLPFNFLRVNAYKFLFRYKILSSRIGFGTIILVNDIELHNCKIGAFNKFIGPMKVIVKNNASIGSHNIFNCPDWSASKEYEHADYRRLLLISDNTYISNYHYFDLAGQFILGENSWIAGAGSQFWTHGGGIVERNITIGKDCYIGSAVRFAPGSGVGSNIIVGMGSVMTKEMNLNNAMIAGVPAKIIKDNYNWKEKE